ncbi:VOC family protein [Pseudokineococcus marinus]|uniref:VOC family protein n=2 Tax=Pseudokineococcus marinus TaxID=351215 RepID=A0A849BKF1_9ACTN|nr:VOC family protein [Pseudokineococcus marinus]NNH23680.1 VOC family protein [Pseudokineococcus marinus]
MSGGAMTTEMCPYLHPRGSAREALAAYRRALGGAEPAMTTYGSLGMDDPSVRDMVANAVLRTEVGGPLMVSDLPPGADEPAGVACLFGDDEGALRAAWDVLAEGAEVFQPLEPSPWGSLFGSLRDRWGVSWLVDVDGAAGAAG